MDIKIGGKIRGVKFNQLSLEELIKNNLSGMEGVGATYAIVHAGLVGSSFVRREEIDYTFENVADWIDEISMSEEGIKIISEVISAFVESTAYKNLIPKEALRPQDNKKKMKMKK